VTVLSEAPQSMVGVSGHYEILLRTEAQSWGSPRYTGWTGTICCKHSANLIKIYLAKYLKHKGNLLINQTQMQA